MQRNARLGAIVGLVGSFGLAAWISQRSQPLPTASEQAAREKVRPVLRDEEQQTPNERNRVFADPVSARSPTRPSDEARGGEKLAVEDQRRKADAIRHRIQQRKARGEPQSLRPVVGPTDDTEAKRREYVQQALREQYVPVAKACYEELLSRDAKANGRVVVRFSIVGDPDTGGVVDRVEFTDETTFEDSDFTQCMRESMYASIFEPPPEGTPEVSVVYPLELSQ
jgi:hypothetical protein